MKCKDVTAKIDLGQLPTTLIGKIRFRAHLLVCKVCNEYSKMSAALRTAIREMVSSTAAQFNVEKLNHELLDKHASKSHNNRLK